MKRLLLAGIPLAFVIAGYFFIRWDPNAPKFVPIRSFKVPAYTGLAYEFLASRPFAGGKMWISLQNSTNRWATYLFDLEQRKVLGELHNAGPVFLNRDQTQLLCRRRGPGKHSLIEKGRLLAEKIVSPRFLPWKPKSPSANDIETFWLLDLRSNSATPLASVSQLKGGASTFRPAPDFRFGFNRPTASHDTMLVCDLEKKRGTFLKVEMYERAVGWWDNQTILLQNLTNDFRLLNVVSGRSSPILRATNVVAFLDQQAIGHVGRKPSAFAEWNGRQYEFYIADTHQKVRAAESFLLRMERPDGRLTVVSPKFKFGSSDHFDDTQSYYVGQHNDGIFLRDLKTKSEKTLAEFEGAKYMMPNFYGTNVIYIRSNQLWRIDFNGSNNVCLFPPADQ